MASEPNSSLPAWRALTEHAASAGQLHLRELFARDGQRAANFRVEHGHWLLDLSRQRITAQTLALVSLGFSCSTNDTQAAQTKNAIATKLVTGNKRLKT